MTVDGTTEDELLGNASEGAKIACDWSADGKVLICTRTGRSGDGTTDLWAVPMSGDRTALPVVKSPHDERDGHSFRRTASGSHTNRTIGTTGRFTRSHFRAQGPRCGSRSKGAARFVGAATAGEVFYVAPDQRLMAVTIDPSAGASGVGKPVPLFTTHIAPIRSISRQQYVVSSDGQGFLISSTEDPPAAPITVLLNWKAKGARNGEPR